MGGHLLEESLQIITNEIDFLRFAPGSPHPENILGKTSESDFSSQTEGGCQEFARTDGGMSEEFLQSSVGVVKLTLADGVSENDRVAAGLDRDTRLCLGLQELLHGG